LALFSLIVPFLADLGVAGFARRGDMAGGAHLRTFFCRLAIRHLNYVSPALASIGAAVICLSACGASLCLATQDDLDVGGVAQRRPFPFDHAPAKAHGRQASASQVQQAWLPLILLCLIPGDVGMPPVKAFLDNISHRDSISAACTIWCLDHRPWRLMPTPEPAFFRFFFLSYSGTAILITAIISGSSWALRQAHGPGLFRDLSAW